MVPLPKRSIKAADRRRAHDALAALTSCNAVNVASAPSSFGVPIAGITRVVKLS